MLWRGELAMLRLVAAQAETFVGRGAADRSKAGGRGAQAKLRAARALDELADRCAKLATPITQRVRGEKLTDRYLSRRSRCRPIGSAKLDKPTQFGYVAQIAEITPNTRRGAHGRIVPAASLPDDPPEHAAAPNVAKLSTGLASRPRRSRWTAASCSQPPTMP
jgi:hypothetical protein